MAPKFVHKGWFVFAISILFLIDLAILLNIPFLRQILGFLFLTILPGLLILQILKLNKIDFLEKVVLIVGLSISFLMLFGFLINNLSLSVGYETPLSTISILVSFNIAFIIFAIVGYKINQDPVFSLPNFNLSTSEKGFLIVPISFPALSIFGSYLMKTTDNNIILMFLLFLIPAYVVFVCFFNHKFPKRLYPVVIFLISISLLLIFMLRFPHIYGHDVHREYGFFFQTTLDNLHWDILGRSSLTACLSISLLPTIFQSIMNVNAQEYLFKGVYVSICSFSPLAIYVISMKYVDELYAFLASFFFMSQSSFLVVAGSPRTNLAIFFVTLAVMVFFSDKIDPLKKRFLFIVFLLSTIVSHYTTTYMFFIIMLGGFVGMEILSKRYTFKKLISLTLVILFFVLIFFWYSQVTEAAFNSGMAFVEGTLVNLNNFFVEELRSPKLEMLIGKGLGHPILSRANLAVTWGTFILIGIGVLTMLKRYKEMVAISNVKLKKPDFLKTKFEVEYLTLVLMCVGLLVVMVALPFVSVGYEVERLYPFVIIILSVCFVIGGITLSKHFFFLQKKTCAKRESIDQSASQVRAYLVILLILIPYSMFTTGAMYQIFGVPASVNLNSESEGYVHEYIHDAESCAAKWLKKCVKDRLPPQIYVTDGFSSHRLISQGKIPPHRINGRSFSMHNRNIKGYIYLSYNNVVKDKLVVEGMPHDMTKYSEMFVGKNKIYANGGSEVWK